jgi:diguanylate cyclase (GGDEF)-like protein
MTRSLAQIFRRTLLGLLIGLALTGAGVAIILGAPATAREAPSSLFTDSHFYAVLLMIAGFVVALIAVFLSHRDTARGVHADIQSIGHILRDARHNEMRDSYPMELEEFGNIFQYLRDSARKMAEERQKLKGLGYLDHLSHLANRRYFERRLRKLHRQVDSHGPSSLLVIDIDHFKQVNDTHGHDVGDALIAEFSRVLRAAVRQTDFLARLGGDEFCVIYPYTPLTHAYSYAERLRKQLPRELKLPKGVVHSLRWTGGISAMSNADSKFDEALWRADQALMRAKQAGRNNTQLEAVGTHPPAARSGSLT